MFSMYQYGNDQISMKNKITLPKEVVKFFNIKSKYYLNEDILLEYMLDPKVS